MKPRGDGDCFYECLQSELRSLYPLPSALKTKELYSEWHARTIGEDASMARATSLQLLESLFDNQVKVIITIDGDDIQSPMPASNATFIVNLQYADGVYRSHRYHRNNSARWARVLADDTQSTAASAARLLPHLHCGHASGHCAGHSPRPS